MTLQSNQDKDERDEFIFKDNPEITDFISRIMIATTGDSSRRVINGTVVAGAVEELQVYLTARDSKLIQAVLGEIEAELRQLFHAGWMAHRASLDSRNASGLRNIEEQAIEDAIDRLKKKYGVKR